MKRIISLLFLVLIVFTNCTWADTDKEPEDIMNILSSENARKINYFSTKLLFEYLIPLSNYRIGQANGVSCTLCKAGASAITSLITEESIQSFYKIAYDLCEIVMAKGFCEPIISFYGDVAIKEILGYMKHTEDFCTKLSFCEYSGKYLNATAYAEYLLQDKPDKKKEPIDESAPKFSFVSLNDVHFDASYKEGTEAKSCGYSICCREYNDSFASLTKETKAGKYGYPGACDTSDAMFSSFLDKVEELHPDFIIWLGDNTPHDVWQGSTPHIIATAQLLKDKLDNRFKHKFPIYPILGNHEKFPCDQFTFNETELVEGLANVYKDYLDDQAYESFRNYGYYTMKHLDTNIRIVALNCFLCDLMNFNFLSSHRLAQMQIKWLENVLREAEKAGEFVYILDHFPINSNFETTECGLRLKALIDRFSYIVRGHFSGHTHTDDITIVTEFFDHSKPISANFIAPSLTTFSKHFPAFRIYYADSNTKNIIDYVQYFLNVTKANADGKAVWELNYQASTAFGAKNMQDLTTIYNMETEGDYIIHRFGNTPEAIKKAHKEVEIRRAKCCIQNDNYHDYLECAFPKISIKGIPDWFFELLNRFQGLWVDEGILDR